VKLKQGRKEERKKGSKEVRMIRDGIPYNAVCNSGKKFSFTSSFKIAMDGLGCNPLSFQNILKYTKTTNYIKARRSTRYSVFFDVRLKFR